MEKWLKWAIEIQSLAQAGLTYTDNVYDIERYEKMREQNNISLNIDDLIANFDKALSHPDEDDLKTLEEIILSGVK